MKIYKRKLDYNESKAIYNEFKEFIIMKDCYNNVERIVVNDYALNNKYPDIKVAYGAWKINLNDNKDQLLYAKHCFFTFNNKVIDPTYCVVNEESYSKEIDYLVFKEFTLNEYIDILLENDGDTSLEAVLGGLFRKITSTLFKRNIFILG